MRRGLVWPLLNRIYYGWVMLLAVSVGQVVSWGILYYTFAVFVTPMATELGWQTSSLTAGYALALLCSGIAAVPVGRWLDRHGPRALMTAGSCAAVLLLVAWASVRDLWMFYLIMAAIGTVMATVLYEPAFAIVATWFRRQRGRALALLTFFGAWASVIFIPLSAWLVERAGWRAALLMLAGILAVATIPSHALLLRRRPSDLGLLPDGASAADDTTLSAPSLPEHSISAGMALREARFWWLTLVFTLNSFASVALTVLLIPYLLAHGPNGTEAAGIAGLAGLASLAGRLIIGPLGDRYPKASVTAGLLVMQMIGLAVLAVVPTAVGAIVAIICFGAGSGTMTIMRAALLAEQYGPIHYGSIAGAQNLVLTGAKTLAPLAAGLFGVSSGGSPILLWALAGGIGIGLGALTQLLRIRPATPVLNDRR